MLLAREVYDIKPIGEAAAVLRQAVADSRIRAVHSLAQTQVSGWPTARTATDWPAAAPTAPSGAVPGRGGQIRRATHRCCEGIPAMCGVRCSAVTAAGWQLPEWMEP